MLSKKPTLNKFLVLLLAAGCLAIILLLTDPQKVSLPLLTIPFVIIGFILYQITCLLLMIKKPPKDKYFLKAIPLTIAVIGVSLLLLQSLHQLTWRDTFLACVFAGLFWLYMWRADFLEK